MGNQACCSGQREDPQTNFTDTASHVGVMEAAEVQQPKLVAQSAPPPEPASCSAQVKREEVGLPVAAHSYSAQVGPPSCYDKTTCIELDKEKGGDKLGIEVECVATRAILPILKLGGGLFGQWNEANPYLLIEPGDSIVEVNGCRGNAEEMMKKLKKDKVLKLAVGSKLTYWHLVADIVQLVNTQKCGPLLIRLCWHDPSSFLMGSVAVPLLASISAKYCPLVVSHADLWALAANVSIRLMGGPDIVTRFGRVDAKSREGCLPGGDGGPDPLRWIVSAEGMSEKDVVALSGAKCVGNDCPGYEERFQFDNSYFKSLLLLCSPQKSTLLASDEALIRDPRFRGLVETYAADQDAFFADFAESWARLQELGWKNLYVYATVPEPSQA